MVSRRACLAGRPPGYFSRTSDFRNFVGSKRLVGDVTSAQVNNWVSGSRRQGADGKPSNEPLRPPTKAKCKRYLSVFLTWCYKTFDLSGNPMAKALPVPGEARHPENIIAIRRFTELKALLNGLRHWPYWQAWVAAAVLEGPRWAEEAWLKVGDVYFDSGYMRVTARTSGRRVEGTKTGRERNVPLERTLLAPILKKHIASLPAGCVWLFPRISRETGEVTTERWCASSNFLVRRS